MKTSMRSKLILFFIALSCLPLLGGSALLLVELRARQQKVITVEVRGMAEGASQGIAAFVNNQFSLIEHAGAAYAETFLNPPLRGIILERTLSEDRDLQEITVTDARGKEISGKSATRMISARDLGNRAGQKEFIAVQERGYYIGPTYLLQDRPMFMLGRGIYDVQDTHKLRYVIFVLVSGDRIREITREFSERMIDGKVYVTTSSGNGTGKNVIGVSQSVTISPDGGEKLAVNWVIVAEEKLPSLFASVSGAGSLWFPLLLTILAFAGIIGIRLSERISYSLTILRAVSRSNSAGAGGSTSIQEKAGPRHHYDIEHEVDGLAGKVRELESTISALRYERETLLAGRDILSLVLSEIGDAVIAVDRKRNIILFNTAAEKITGFDAADMLGKPLQDFLIFLQDDKKIDPDLYCPVDGDAEGIVFSAEKLRLDTGKTERYVSLHVGKTKKNVDLDIGAILTLHDLTRERTFDKIKQEFVAITAHQMRTPLTEVRWSLEMLLAGDLGKLPKLQKEMIVRSFSSNERMIKLVDDLLHCAKIEHIYGPVKKEPIDLIKLVKDSTWLLKKEARKRKLRIEVEKPETAIPEIRGDERAVRSIVANVLHNALIYTPAGGVISISFRKGRKSASVIIRDTGIGIPPDEHGMIFNKFFRAKNAMKTETDASGLGLYIAKRLVDRHGGELTFTSQLNKGSTFTISLPVTKEA